MKKREGRYIVDGVSGEILNVVKQDRAELKQKLGNARYAEKGIEHTEEYLNHIKSL